MSRRMFLLITGPAVLVGLLLTGACLASVWSLSRLQENLAAILSDNVASLRAAQDLQIELRSLRFHAFMAAIDPTPERQRVVADDRVGFEAAFQIASQSATVPGEAEVLDGVSQSYAAYVAGLAPEGFPPPGAPPVEFIRWADAHPVRPLMDQCDALVRLNEKAMLDTAHESEAVVARTRSALWVLGLAGPIGGLVAGLGIARGLSRSIARLSVHVRDLHADLDREVGSVRIDSDLSVLDRQLERVVGRVREVVARLHETEREALRAEQLAAVGQLAAGMAHNIRNPLTAVKLLVSAALHRGPGGALTPADLAVIHGEVGRLEQTVEGLLDLARPAPARPEPGDVRDDVRHAVDLVRARADNQGIALDVVLPDQPVPAARDRGPFGMALVNLLWNALDATPPGGTVAVSLTCEAGQARLVFRDTGPGLPAEMAGRLFTPFASTKSTGTGLGLATCRRVIEQHGGTVAAADHPDGGAVFTLTLPTQDFRK